jgi:hypothetical protein
MVSDVAVTAPVPSAGPTALAHLPTTRSVGDAVPVVVKAVVAVKVTTTLEVALVVGLVSLTDTVDPLRAVTDPDAAAKEPPAKRPPPNPPLPAGREPVPGVPPGGVPPPDRPKPPLHVPATGWETETVVAVTGPPNRLAVDVEPEVGVPNAEMHEPTVTAETVVGVIWRNVVAEV